MKYSMLLGAVALVAGPLFSQDIVDPAVVDAKRTAILNYITELSSAPKFRGIISGQNAYHGDEIINNGNTVRDPKNPWENVNGYERLVEGLHTATGKWVGILGVDYEFQRAFTSEQLSAANEVLIQYAQQNGIIAITFSPQNPWVNDESDLYRNPGAWDGPAATQNKAGFSKVKLDDLFDPSKLVHGAWMRKLDRIGGALQELRDAGVVVLFRPMQEMNGDWFWWGKASHPNDPAPYARMYQKMRAYFTETWGLNNLLWVYSPAGTHDSSWIQPVGWAYPGADAVDIVAGTEYNESMSIGDYNGYVRLNKPLGMGEYSPNDGMGSKVTWDMAKLTKVIRERYPKIAFWVAWHHYETQRWDILSNKNSNTLMNDPLVITRDDLPNWAAD